MGRKVFKAVIPAAGRGMRMRPFSLVLPKEMMPLGRKPMIQFAVEEAVAAGIHEVCIVIRRGKEIIKDYLLKGTLHGSDGFERVLRSCRLTFAYQKKWDGLGGALWVARTFVGRDPFLMIIPDQLFHSRSRSPSQQLLSRYQFTHPVVLSSMVKIPKREISYFRGSKGFVLAGGRSHGSKAEPISRILSDAETSRSFLNRAYEIRGFGRTIFPAAIFAYLDQRYINPRSGEIDLSRTFKEFPKKFPNYGYLLIGRACDLGSWAGYCHYLPFFLRDS